jgi:transcriptional regulator with XRE-family HTH domain
VQRSLALFLSERRERLGWSITDVQRRLVARDVDVTVATVSRWFNPDWQHGRAPTLGHFVALLDVLSITGWERIHALKLAADDEILGPNPRPELRPAA